MNFTPVVPLGGLSGWALLSRTSERQTDLFNKSPQIVRDTEYFEQNIAKITTAEGLVSDRRLLRVALGAFGLQEDINSRAFIRAILEEGTIRDDAIANRLADDRYKQLSEAFAFADRPIPRTQLSTFGTEITDKFRRREFEVAVGDQNQALRLALNVQRELGDIAGDAETEDTRWFRILGNPPLRRVFEVALGLPDSFGQADLDRQLDEIKSRSAQQLKIGSLSDLSAESVREQLIQRFLLREQVASFNVQSSQAIALTLLQSVPRRA
ncbi:DUF1217 domain-containing protein [Roseovarius mucosus]|uniref:DUF1217 domain-containing protein n=1 Tax=Roseovarius mucosus TaxID=215743 RepID=UPI001C5D519A|nr:DUF1217 domain-containing protein [Roseovarius mucosus]MBW4974445.1 DUF1217 domain-containing protein [Roseovarius mucosus]